MPPNINHIEDINMNRDEKLKVMNGVLDEIRAVDGSYILENLQFVEGRHADVVTSAIRVGYTVVADGAEMNAMKGKADIKNLIKVKLSAAMRAIRELTEDALEALEGVE